MAGIAKDAWGDLEFVIEVGEQVGGVGSPKAAHFGVFEGEHYSLKAGHDSGTGAHRAGFFGDVEGALVESPVADSISSLGDREYFCVCGGVF